MTALYITILIVIAAAAFVLGVIVVAMRIDDNMQGVDRHLQTKVNCPHCAHEQKAYRNNNEDNIHTCTECNKRYIVREVKRYVTLAHR